MSQNTHGPHLLQRLRVVAPWLADDLPDADGTRLLTGLDTEVLPSEHVLLDSGQHADGAWLVVDGELLVSEWNGVNALETRVHGAGSLIGLDALVLPGASARAVQTRGRAAVARIGPELYLGSLTRSPLIAGRIAARAARRLARRLRRMTAELARRAGLPDPTPITNDDTPVPAAGEAPKAPPPPPIERLPPLESDHGSQAADRHLLLATFDEMGLFRRVSRGRPDLAEALRGDLEVTSWPMLLHTRLHDELLQAQGTPPAALNVVLAGKARREVRSIDGDDPISLKALLPGDTFGQTGLCDGLGASAEVRALGACSVAQILPDAGVRLLDQAALGLPSAARFTDWMASQIATDLAFVREEGRQGAAA